jgi:pimeloyl-ACP methyl ester carboxylesterase
MPEVTNDGATIHYEVTGEGPPVLLGHSLLCDTEMWRGVVPRLARRYKVINVEARAHRRSTAPGPFTLEDLAEDWKKILDAERVPRAFLVGLSMGGMTSLRMALSAPSRVAGMILIDSNGDAEERAKRLQYGALAAIYQRVGLVGPLTGRVAKIMLGKTTLAEKPQLVEELRTTVSRHDRSAIGHALRAVFRRGPILQRLSAIDCPTLVLVGDEDKATPPIKSQRLAAAIRGAKLERIPRVGHLSALEDPEAVANRVLGFLEQHRW